MPVSDDDRFAFDCLGYLHLRGAMGAEELAEYDAWVEATAGVDPVAVNQGDAEALRHQLNRPVSRVFDADSRFGRFLDHPVVEPYLVELLGDDYKHIDNDLYFTYPGYAGGGWHRGVRAHPTGHVVDGRFICPMVKVFYCLSDVGPGQGEFVVVPGSHRSMLPMVLERVDLPAQHIFDDITAGDIILFNEALLHNGRPNPSDHLRRTMIVNFGRADAGVWPGYRPTPRTLAAVTPRQREILSNRAPVWSEPVLA